MAGEVVTAHVVEAVLVTGAEPHWPAPVAVTSVVKAHVLAGTL
jgi:hypothetical protein